MSKNIVWHNATVRRKHRNSNNGHKSVVLWFTGLSGSGKSTLAHAVEEELHQLNCQTTVLDGDNVRHGLCRDLGFGEEDRTENIRRIGEVCRLLIDTGVITLAAFISPSSHDRDQVRKIITKKDFIEVYVNCPLEVCEKRDVKGVYKRVRLGEIKEFTGVSAPYDIPDKPDIVIDTEAETIEESLNSIMRVIYARNIIQKKKI